MIRAMIFLFAASTLAWQVQADVNASIAGQPQVWVEVNRQTQGYFEPPRLGLVLQQAAQDKTLYWPAARLYRVDNLPAELAQQQQRVLEQLRLLAIHWHEEPRVAQALMQMRTEIKNWRFGDAIAVKLDPLLVQQRVELNPRLDPGRYFIQVQKRRAVVQIFSLFGEQYETHQQQKMLYEYVAPVLNSGFSKADVALLMRHAETPIEVPVADWNRQERPLAPGDVVFIAVSEDWLTPETLDLNQRIVFLLQHRIHP